MAAKKEEGWRGEEEGYNNEILSHHFSILKMIVCGQRQQFGL